MQPPKPGPLSAPDLDILQDTVAIHPAGYEAGSDHEQNLVEHMARFRESPFDFLREISLHVSGMGWRAYEDPIGPPVYHRGFSENMVANVMRTPILKERIEHLARRRVEDEERMGLYAGDFGHKKAKRLEEITQSLNDVSTQIVDDMICKMDSKRFIRSAYYFATQLLTRAYHQGIHVSSEEVVTLRTVALEAEKKKQPIIFLPCHRSHVDYVSLQVICYRLGMALPTVVAGDNLAIVGLKQFLQRAGAMWIRRSFAGDALYGTIVQSYIETLMREGYYLEAFVEGGRSRTGKLLPPKFGILSYVLDAVLSGRVDDALICPMSNQYDKVIETESYVSELLGKPKAKENLSNLLSASSVLSLKLGRVDVRFHKPWSLKEFIQDQQTRTIRLSSPPPATENRVRLLRTLGYRVLSDVNRISVVMPTALVGTVLLTLRGRGVGKSELVRRVEWLSERVRAKHARVAHFHGAPTITIVERALDVLGPGLVGKIEGLVEDTYYAVDRFQMSFYRNMTIHLFITEALVSVAMYTKVKLGGGPANQRITYQDLYYQVSFLSQLFQSEFIYPTEGLPANLQNTLEGLEADSVVKLARNDHGVIETIELSDIERSRGREDYDFYCFLMWPFVEASWLAAVSLMALTPPLSLERDLWVEMKQAQDMAQLFGKTLYHQGDLSYYEAVNKQTLLNAVERFADDGIMLAVRSKEPKTPVTVKLAPEWTPERDKDGKILPKGKLWDFIDTM
ncbi:MAG: hypothetical protein MMC23_009102 [Stictis urceolatum]|nr:hypothetical protein [Stictis urceolata]